MSRITGIFGSGAAQENASLLQRMLLPMLHEHFHSSSTYASAELGINSAFVSSAFAGRPRLTWSDARDIGCFIAGEAFIEPTNMHRKDAASVLIQLYKQHGIKSLEQLNGWFSGVLVDLQQRRSILFNDRYGLSRIYVSEQQGRLFFSSEAKSLLAGLPGLRELDPRGLAEWLSCGCALGNRTLFRGISLLSPGSAWIFSADGALKKDCYFNPSRWENQPELSPERYYQRLKELFPRILKRYTNGSEPVAMSLTGGLDGRMIMAWNRPNPGKLPCYTFNGSYRDCADVRIARKVAAACDQSHQTISVAEEFLAQFPQLAEQTIWIADGSMDVSGAAELYVNRLARRVAPVRLTGNYGSEILRRHVAFKPRALSSEVLSHDFDQEIAAVVRTYSEELGDNQLSFIAFKQMPWHHYPRLAVEQSQISIRSPFLDNSLVELAFQAPPEAATSVGPSLRLIKEGNPILAQIPTDRGISYPATWMTNRVHRPIKEFLAKAEYAYDYGMPAWLARIDRALKPLQLERLFLGRQKFCHFRTWYRHQLAGYVKDMLLDSGSRSRWYVNGSSLETLINSHVKGLCNYTVEIHKLLSLELLHRTLLD